MVAVVERKSVEDLVSTIVGGKFWMLLAEAAVEHVDLERLGDARTAQLVPAGSVPHRAPTPAEVRTWAAEQGLAVSDRGRIPIEVMRAYLAEHGSS